MPHSVPEFPEVLVLVGSVVTKEVITYKLFQLYPLFMLLPSNGKFWHFSKYKRQSAQ